MLSREKSEERMRRRAEYKDYRDRVRLARSAGLPLPIPSEDVLEYQSQSYLIGLIVIAGAFLLFVVAASFTFGYAKNAK